MLAMFDQRHALTAGAQEEATRSVAEAEKKIAEYTARVSEARQAAQQDQKAMRGDSLTAERKLLESVRAEEDGKLQEAIASIHQEAEKAAARLESSADELGKQIATRLLGGAA